MSTGSDLNTPPAPPPPTGGRSRWSAIAWVVLWFAVLYFVIVLPLDQAVPSINRLRMVPVVLLATAALTWLVHRFAVARARDADERAKSTVLLTVVVLATFLAADVGFTAYANIRPEIKGDARSVLDNRIADLHVWDGELMPHLYAPPQSQFLIYKPGQSRSATVFGEHYYSGLLRHPTLRDSVLELRQVSFAIDSFGLRNTDAPAAARLFLLGDSFAFGYHTTQDSIVPALLKRALGEPVYNLGVSGTSPVQQVALLEDLLRKYPQDFKPSRVLWMIFEGNDLEESTDNSEGPVAESGPSISEIIDGTIVGGILGIPAMIRRQSLIRFATRAGATSTNALARTTRANHHELDGEPLLNPLYRSGQFGPRLFRQMYLDRGVEPASYVESHPNSGRVTEAFRRMRALADASGFAVTVVAVPTDARLYKDAFEDFPPITERAHFIRFAESLAGESQFEWIDLHEKLAPIAATEMLYYRDDTHWNERGHRIVAELLADHLRTGTSATRHGKLGVAGSR